MKLIDLKLKGFIGLNKGMGLDEISLPLADLSGLVAFDGPNGRGKTTILENMQPFRTFASRRGTLKKHCFAKDSQKELTLEYNGDIIRTLIKMDAQTTRADEGFIWVNDKPIVDGKPTSYDKAIKEIFGSPNLFFWSIFCAQNSKKLTDLTTGKMKELFTEFLRLDRYAGYEDTVKQALGMVQGIGSGALLKAQHIANELEKYKGIRPEVIIKDEGEALEANQHSLEKLQLEIERIRTGIEDAKAEITANEIKLKNKEAIGQDLLLAKDALIELINEKAHKQTSVGHQLDKVQVQITETLKILEGAEEIKQAADRCFSLDTQIKGLAGEIEVARKAADNMQAELNNVNQAVVDKMQILDNCKNSELVKQAQVKADELTGRQKEVSALTLEKDPDYIVMRAEIKGLQKRTGALDQKDADCISEKCGLITDALNAKEELMYRQDTAKDYAETWNEGHLDSMAEIAKAVGEAEDHLAALQENHQAEVTEAEQNLAAAKAKVQIVEDDLNPIQASIGVKGAQKKTMQVEFDDLTPLAKKAVELEIAAANLSRLEEQEDAIKRQNAEIEKEYSAKTAAQEKVVTDLATRIGAIKLNEDAETEWQGLVETLKARKGAEEQLAKTIRNSENKILDATRMAETIKGLQADLKEAQDAQGIVTGELVQWEYLKAACGKKGLQALEIDGVSPVIQQYANDLLISTFGPMNTIRFETQDEDMKEVLNIIVMDPDGTETMLENKSGGEAVWILKSLRLALTLLSKEKGGRDFRTVLMDEEDGALSPANAVKFIGLYRSMMDIGGFDTCYYISHKQEAVGLANHRLIFGEKGIEID
jgi:exonuclease SbcC